MSQSAPPKTAGPGEEIVAGVNPEGQDVGPVPRSVVARPEISGIYGRGAHVLFSRPADSDPDLRTGTPVVDCPLYAFAIRSASKSVWPGAYDFTAGGVVASGESDIEAAIRETQEELGISLSRGQLRVGFRWTPSGGFYSFGTVFVCDWDGPVIPFNPADIAEIEWLTPLEVEGRVRRGAPAKPDLCSLVMSPLWAGNHASHEG